MSCLADAPAISAEWCNRRQFFFAKSLEVSKFCCTFAADKGSDFADAPAISAEW